MDKLNELIDKVSEYDNYIVEDRGSRVSIFRQDHPSNPKRRQLVYCGLRDENTEYTHYMQFYAFTNPKDREVMNLIFDYVNNVISDHQEFLKQMQRERYIITNRTDSDSDIFYIAHHDDEFTMLKDGSDKRTKLNRYQKDKFFEMFFDKDFNCVRVEDADIE